ncbi:MAG TPA: septal ring lytic transglycosylase RlpA family protein [Gammaproteobacteria bacterium]
MGLRVRRCAALMCVLLALLQWGCASRPERASARAPDPINPPRSALGNPPFYEVLGKRYYVLESSDGFVERGIASWYGRKFHRHRTSSGERYDMNAMTAAHKTLPLPTWVEVTNLDNGRRVIVKVNDRGPFVDDRIIDLSYAAAEALDMVRAGTARVEVRALGAAPIVAEARGRRSRRERRAALSLISEAHAASPAREERGSGALFIQVGAFSQRDNAAQLVERLRDSGFDKVFVVSGSDDRLHRVRLGPFTTVAEYDRVTEGLRRVGVADTRLVVGP